MLFLISFKLLVALASCSDVNADCRHIGSESSWDAAGIGLLLMLSCLAAAAGIGGSCMIASVMLVVFRFDTYLSAANTLAFIAAGSITVIFLKLKHLRSTKDHLAIDNNFIFLVTCPLTFGVQLGIILNHSAPEWFLLFLITLVSLLTFTDTVQKALRLHYRRPNPSHNMISTVFPCISRQFQASNPQLSINSQALYFSANSNYILSPSCSSFSLFFLSSLFYTCYSVKYKSVFWPITVYFAFTIVISSLTTQYLTTLSRNSLMTEETLTVWTTKNCIIIIIFTMIAGILVGLLGTGSGHIISPIIVALSLSSNSVSVTHSFCVFLAAASGSFNNFISGAIPPSYFAIFASVSTIGNIIGITVIRPKLLKHDKIPHLLFVISLITLTSLFLYLYLTIINL